MRKPHISAIELENFKCFRKQRVELGGLTVLSGLNGMGKSSTIQALLLLRQSLSNQRLQRRLRLSGDLIDLGTGEDALFDLADQDAIAFVLELEQSRRIEYRYEYSRENDRLSLVMPRQVGRATSDRILNSEGNWVNYRADAQRSLPGIGLPTLFSSTGFQYLSAERFGPRKSLPWSNEQTSTRSLGIHGEHVLAYLAEFGGNVLDESDPRVRDPEGVLTLEGQVSSWLQETSPGATLDISRMREIDALSARYAYSRKGDVQSRAFRATNVGFGISYVLPVLTALIGASSGDLVIIENPEAHLHPRGQTRLGQLAGRAAKSGVQVLIETHSDHFLDGVRLDVKHQISDGRDTRIHFFTRSGSEAEVISPRVLGNGSLSEWPRGFFDERDENLLGLLG
jgi:predicted ATPase